MHAHFRACAHHVRSGGIVERYGIKNDIEVGHAAYLDHRSVLKDIDDRSLQKVNSLGVFRLYLYKLILSARQRSFSVIRRVASEPYACCRI